MSSEIVSDFFAFRYFITTAWLKLAYAIGAVAAATGGTGCA